MTPQDEFILNQKRLELAEANTADILERYDNIEYHRLTWRHVRNCKACGSETEAHKDILPPPTCPECGNPAELKPFVEIVEYDESYGE